MVIYSNNLHQKLQGIAISKEYLKYNTPFCDLVDDPDWQLDFDLAIGYNSAINGNLSAADSFIKNLTLNSSFLDWSTLDYYAKKTTNNPIFASSIREIQNRFDTPAMFDDGYQQSLNQQLKDCLNSPCNLFLQTSDSVGRMAQAASTKNSSNTFGVGALSASMTNMLDDLDQTIFNKIPALFQDGFLEITGVANKAWTNTQAVLAGKKNISELNKLAQEGRSFRNTDKVYRYTPDIKSYNDYSAAGSMILNKIKESLGGCFDKFQYKYRYNPYNENGQFPSGDRVISVNGKDIEADGAGKIHRTTNNNKNFKGQTGNVSALPPRSIIPSAGNAISDGTIAVSKVYNLSPKGNGVRAHYSVFAGLIDETNNILWYENYSKLDGDIMTLKGINNINETDYRIGISYFGSNDKFLKDALNKDITPEQAASSNAYIIPGAYARGYRHNLTTEGMETLYNTRRAPNYYLNDGVAISQTLFKDFVNDPQVKPLVTTYKKLQLKNQFFAALRVPNGEWYYYKVIDWNGQKDANVDLTVGAYQHFMDVNGLGPLGIPPGTQKEIKGTGWTKVKKISHDNLGPLEVRLCQGNINDIKAKLGAAPVVGSEDDPFSQANIDAGNWEGAGEGASDDIEGDKAVETSVALNENSLNKDDPRYAMAQREAKLQAENDRRNKLDKEAESEFRQRVSDGESKAEANKLRVEKLNDANRNVGFEYYIKPNRPNNVATRRKPNWNPNRDQVVRDTRFD